LAVPQHLQTGLDKTFSISGLYQTYISDYLKIIGMDPNWEKGQDPGKFPTQVIYMDNIFKAKSKEKLKEIIVKVYGETKIPNGLNLDLLSFEPN